MKRTPLYVALTMLAACIASESGNPATRCDSDSSCPLDQACYRGFCIGGDGEGSITPVTEDDAGEPVRMDANVLPRLDARVEEPSDDAGDTAIADAAAEAAVHDAATDAGRTRDAGPVVRADAAMPCQTECKQPNNPKCKKCLQELVDEDIVESCGKPIDGNSGSDEDQAEWAEAANDPLCVSLCLGAASTKPGCGPQLKKFGGKP